MPSRAAAALERVRTLCLAYPETSERISHGAPTFFVREKRSFVTFHDDHHGDGRLALWCAAPPGAQAMLVEANADAYFVPAYVGHLGWIGVRLDRGLPWPEIAAVIEHAYQMRAPKRRAASAGRAEPRAAAKAASTPRRRAGPR
ncbi:phosphoribosylglycinamide formyltransferase [Sorangium cellulosum]|uniref:Phosphoribosylglycinamide formyltransferase n=1 Tax=Sorangium cellulosum TaxID=56 RepID=A0A4P2PU76_SORCE|nr:MmcQ/YjbR family DNA-binding protein [Sorangium cellulosum]AUX20148.1 phosphoribosylglycinamide formyltransferase [Sorangium cellulosum]